MRSQSPLEDRKPKSWEITILRYIKLWGNRFHQNLCWEYFWNLWTHFSQKLLMYKRQLRFFTPYMGFTEHDSVQLYKGWIFTGPACSYWPIKAVLHLSHVFYKPFPDSFDWLSGLELPVQEVIEYDHHKSHEVIWLKINTSN